MLMLIETLVLILAIVIGVALPRRALRRIDTIKKYFVWMSDRKDAVFLVGALALALRLPLLLVEPAPRPYERGDDYCYLLAAETFSNGHLTNPSHPMREHFESLGIIQSPTYQCAAQPAQGFLLAVGMRIFGHPFWGVWLSCGLMCTTICWMLQGWMQRNWALLGGLLAVFHFGVFSYWANSYWGGALGAIGGALVWGALPRILNTQRAADAWLMGLGLALLATSRPYEGFVLAIPAAVAMAVWTVEKWKDLRNQIVFNVIPPLTTCVIVLALFLGYYNWRVTGKAVSMPYQVQQASIGVPYFIWQSVGQNSSSTASDNAARTAHLATFRESRSIVGVLFKLLWAWAFFLGPSLTATVTALPFALPYGLRCKDISRTTKFLVVSLTAFVLCVLGETFFAPHYFAPATCIILAIPLLALRSIREWDWKGKELGLIFTRVVPLVCLLSFVLRAIALPLHIPLTASYAAGWYQAGPGTSPRELIREKLEKIPGKHLVLVHSTPAANAIAAWVKNASEIDSAKVAWANDLGPARNQELICYFKGRRVWMAESSEKSEVIPYDGLTLQGPSGAKQKKEQQNSARTGQPACGFMRSEPH